MFIRVNKKYYLCTNCSPKYNLIFILPINVQIVKSLGMKISLSPSLSDNKVKVSLFGTESSAEKKIVAELEGNTGTVFIWKYAL